MDFSKNEQVKTDCTKGKKMRWMWKNNLKKTRKLLTTTQIKHQMRGVGVQLHIIIFKRISSKTGEET